MNDILTVKDLAIAYDGKNIVENLSFNVEKDDFLVIFGENGSGKSSLAKTLLGLKKSSDGVITFSGNLKPNEIGYLPQSQNIRSDFPASSWEVVLSGCLNKMGLRPFYTKKEKLLAKENMELLDIYNLKNECFRNLSGGQRQKVLLARALCAATKLVLLDEPVSGLDQHSTAEFYRLVQKINQSGMAVIMISHDIASSVSVAKHVLEITGHNTHFFGSIAQYRERRAI